MSHPNDLVRPWCVVCGKKASNLHHEPPKGLGGIGSKGTEPPRLSLCGSGTTGCHGARHAGLLEFQCVETHGGKAVWFWRRKSGRGWECWNRCIDASEEEFGW